LKQDGAVAILKITKLDLLPSHSVVRQIFTKFGVIFDSMTIEQALEAGLRAEETAREFYRREAGRTTDPELQKAYRELGEFEETHVSLLKEKLAEKRGGPGSTRR
jgi:rubrerythrin